MGRTGKRKEDGQEDRDSKTDEKERKRSKDENNERKEKIAG